MPEPAALLMPAAPAIATVAVPRTRTCDVDCTLSYQVNGPTDFLFQVHVLNGMDQQVLDESLLITPPLPQHIYADPSVGHRSLRLHADAGPVELRYRARVRRTPGPVDLAAPEMPIAELPDELLHNLSPTRYCESDHLSRAAQKIFGGLPRGYARVQAVVDWIHANVDYQIGSSQPTTTARDVFVQRVGVCRDFAHLGVTFCRALNIPARLVVGYALRRAAAGFSRDVRGLSRRSLAAVRPDQDVTGRRADPHRGRARCEGRGLRDDLRPGDDDVDGAAGRARGLNAQRCASSRCATSAKPAPRTPRVRYAGQTVSASANSIRLATPTLSGKWPNISWSLVESPT